MPINWSKVAKEVNEYRALLYWKDSSDCQKRYHELNKKSTKNDIWTDKEVDEWLKLHKKYGPNWKIISKKMIGKTDKQIMYKVNSILKERNNLINIQNNDENMLRNYSQNIEIEQSNEFENDVVKKTSGELYKEMLSFKNSESLSNSGSSNPKFKVWFHSNIDGSMGVIEEENFAYNDFSVNENDF